MAYIDKVVIVCSGRIERPHVEAIKQFMRWLSYSEYKDNFVLIYNKSDLLSAQRKMENLASMCSQFRVPMTGQINKRVGSEWHTVKTSIALGFPPNANYATVKDDRDSLMLAVTVPRDDEVRIPVDRSKCTIL